MSDLPKLTQQESNEDGMERLTPEGHQSAGEHPS